jgi:hypothetical protein
MRWTAAVAVLAGVGLLACGSGGNGATPPSEPAKVPGPVTTITG